jgi:hypothetical protein
MSRYKEIKTEFRSLTSLLKALEDLSYTADQIEVAPDVKVPTLPMYGYMNDVRPERASVRIPRSHVGRASNDVGFAWNGSSFTAIISEFDSGTHFDSQKVQRLTQRYALHEVKRQARLKGYSVQEVQNTDGSIRLVCRGR